MRRKKINTDELVRREVFCCASYLVQDLIALYWRSQQTDPTAYPKPRPLDLSFGEDEILELTNERNGEVFEHWFVSDWLGSKLKSHGETVVEIGNLSVWCRTTTGQQISADEVFETIAKELES